MNHNHMQYFFATADMSKDDPANSQNGFKTNYRNGKVDQLRLDLVKGDVKGVETALNEGVAADHVLRGDWDLLMYASSLGHSDIVRLLLKKGANPNSCKDKFTPLMTACASRREEARLLACVRLLLQHGALADAQDRFGLTALMYAAREGHADVVAFLLSAGADLQLRDAGWTALFWAINSERKAVTMLLLQAESALYCKNPPELPSGFSLLDSQTERDMGLTFSWKNSDKKIKNGMANGTNKGIEEQLYTILKIIGGLDAHLRSHYVSLDTLRSSLHELSVSRPSTIWPVTSRQLPIMTRRALCTTERLFQQMRFLHRVTEKVVEHDEVTSADFMVQKKTSPFQAWMTFLITSTVVSFALWQMRAPGTTSATYSLSGS